MNIPDTTAKILIVDDEPMNIEVLAEVVERFGDVIFATDGPSAIARCKSEQPDIVLLDVMMPGMDGYTVCQQLHDDPDTRSIPVIFVTALAEENDEAMGFDIGAVDYLTKPISAPIVAARVRNHLELKRYRDYLSEIAFVDALTAIPNRRRFDEQMESEWQRARRKKAPVSVLLMDIDHFKQYNDLYGHQAGDECLRQVAQALKGAVKRPADLVARYGGEEFVCLLPETEEAGALALAQSLCERIRTLDIPHDRSSVSDHVTISVGAATRFTGNGATPADLIESADRNLYQAKDAGRDQVAA